MLTLLSPAKKLLEIEKPYIGEVSTPVFNKKTSELAALLATKSHQEIADLMHLSSALASLNQQRYQNFSESSLYPALYLFQGDVYQSMKAWNWEKDTVNFAQEHLLILSGLYGLLKPLDTIRPYRLEMGTALANACGKNLYEFWLHNITPELNRRLAASDNPLLINLASSEYSRAVDRSSLRFPVINIHFKERKGGQSKIIGVYAKRARGAMADYIMQNQLDNPVMLREFTGLNYHYDDVESSATDQVFVRDMP